MLESFSFKDRADILLMYGRAYCRPTEAQERCRKHFKNRALIPDDETIEKIHKQVRKWGAFNISNISFVLHSIEIENYTCEEKTDMYLIYGLAECNPNIAREMYGLLFPYKEPPLAGIFPLLDSLLRSYGGFDSIISPGEASGNNVIVNIYDTLDSYLKHTKISSCCRSFLQYDETLNPLFRMMRYMELYRNTGTYNAEQLVEKFNAINIKHQTQKKINELQFVNPKNVPSTSSLPSTSQHTHDDANTQGESPGTSKNESIPKKRRHSLIVPLQIPLEDLLEGQSMGKKPRAEPSISKDIDANTQKECAETSKNRSVLMKRRHSLVDPLQIIPLEDQSISKKPRAGATPSTSKNKSVPKKRRHSLADLLQIPLEDQSIGKKPRAGAIPSTSNEHIIHETQPTSVTLNIIGLPSTSKLVRDTDANAQEASVERQNRAVLRKINDLLDLTTYFLSKKPSIGEMSKTDTGLSISTLNTYSIKNFSYEEAQGDSPTSVSSLSSFSNSEKDLNKSPSLTVESPQISPDPFDHTSFSDSKIQFFSGLNQLDGKYFSMDHASTYKIETVYRIMDLTASQFYIYSLPDKLRFVFWITEKERIIKASA